MATRNVIHQQGGETGAECNDLLQELQARDVNDRFFVSDNNGQTWTGDLAITDARGELNGVRVNFSNNTEMLINNPRNLEKYRYYAPGTVVRYQNVDYTVNGLARRVQNARNDQFEIVYNLTSAGGGRNLENVNWKKLESHLEHVGEATLAIEGVEQALLGLDNMRQKDMQIKLVGLEEQLNHIHLLAGSAEIGDVEDSIRERIRTIKAEIQTAAATLREEVRVTIETTNRAIRAANIGRAAGRDLDQVNRELSFDDKNYTNGLGNDQITTLRGLDTQIKQAETDLIPLKSNLEAMDLQKATPGFDLVACGQLIDNIKTREGRIKQLQKQVADIKPPLEYQPSNSNTHVNDKYVTLYADIFANVATRRDTYDAILVNLREKMGQAPYDILVGKLNLSAQLTPEESLALAMSTKSVLETLRDAGTAADTDVPKFNFKTEKDEFNAKIQELRDKSLELKNPNGANRVIEQMQTDLDALVAPPADDRAATATSQTDFLTLYEEWREVKAGLHYAELVKTKAPIESETSEATIDIPVTVLAELVQQNVDRARPALQAILNHIVSSEFADVNKVADVNINIGNQHIDLVKAMFDNDDFANNPQVRQRLRDAGVGNLTEFKKLWREEYAEKVGHTLEVWLRDKLQRDALQQVGGGRGVEFFNSLVHDFNVSPLAAKLLIMAACVGGGAMIFATGGAAALGLAGLGANSTLLAVGGGSLANAIRIAINKGAGGKLNKGIADSVKDLKDASNKRMTVNFLAGSAENYLDTLFEQNIGPAQPPNAARQSLIGLAASYIPGVGAAGQPGVLRRLWNGFGRVRAPEPAPINLEQRAFTEEGGNTIASIISVGMKKATTQESKERRFGFGRKDETVGLVETVAGQEVRRIFHSIEARQLYIEALRQMGLEANNASEQERANLAVEINKLVQEREKRQAQALDRADKNAFQLVGDKARGVVEYGVKLAVGNVEVTDDKINKRDVAGAMVVGGAIGYALTSAANVPVFREVMGGAGGWVAGSKIAESRFQKEQAQGAIAGTVDVRTGEQIAAMGTRLNLLWTELAAVRALRPNDPNLANRRIQLAEMIQPLVNARDGVSGIMGDIVALKEDITLRAQVDKICEEANRMGIKLNESSLKKDLFTNEQGEKAIVKNFKDILTRVSKVRGEQEKLVKGSANIRRNRSWRQFGRSFATQTLAIGGLAFLGLEAGAIVDELKMSVNAVGADMRLDDLIAKNAAMAGGIRVSKADVIQHLLNEAAANPAPTGGFSSRVSEGLRSINHGIADKLGALGDAVVGTDTHNPLRDLSPEQLRDITAHTGGITRHYAGDALDKITGQRADADHGENWLAGESAEFVNNELVPAVRGDFVDKINHGLLSNKDLRNHLIADGLTPEHLSGRVLATALGMPEGSSIAADKLTPIQWKSIQEKFYYEPIAGKEFEPMPGRGPSQDIMGSPRAHDIQSIVDHVLNHDANAIKAENLIKSMDLSKYPAGTAGALLKYLSPETGGKPPMQWTDDKLAEFNQKFADKDLLQKLADHFAAKQSATLATAAGGGASGAETAESGAGARADQYIGYGGSDATPVAGATYAIKHGQGILHGAHALEKSHPELFKTATGKPMTAAQLEKWEINELKGMGFKFNSDGTWEYPATVHKDAQLELVTDAKGKTHMRLLNDAHVTKYADGHGAIFEYNDGQLHRPDGAAAPVIEQHPQAVSGGGTNVAEHLPASGANVAGAEILPAPNQAQLYDALTNVGSVAVDTDGNMKIDFANSNVLWNYDDSGDLKSVAVATTMAGNGGSFNINTAELKGLQTAVATKAPELISQTTTASIDSNYRSTGGSGKSFEMFYDGNGADKRLIALRIGEVKPMPQLPEATPRSFGVGNQDNIRHILDAKPHIDPAVELRSHWHTPTTSELKDVAGDLAQSEYYLDGRKYELVSYLPEGSGVGAKPIAVLVGPGVNKLIYNLGGDLVGSAKGGHYQFGAEAVAGVKPESWKIDFDKSPVEAGNLMAIRDKFTDVPAVEIPKAEVAAATAGTKVVGDGVELAPVAEPAVRWDHPGDKSWFDSLQNSEYTRQQKLLLNNSLVVLNEAKLQLDAYASNDNPAFRGEINEHPNGDYQKAVGIVAGNIKSGFDAVKQALEQNDSREFGTTKAQLSKALGENFDNVRTLKDFIPADSSSPVVIENVNQWLDQSLAREVKLLEENLPPLAPLGPTSNNMTPPGKESFYQ